jgi:hypothetical protein
MSNQPEVPGPVKSLKIMLASVIASELMGGLGYADLEFGVKQALTSVTAAVFDLPASAPLLRDMVDDSLAKFYSDATTTARSEGYSLSHTLHKVSSAVLCNVDILTCAKRGFDYSHLVREGTLLGTSYLRVEPPPRGDITYDDWESQPHIKKAAGVHKSLENFGTIRYTFHVTTSETFCVRSATGTVVQGSEAPLADALSRSHLRVLAFCAQAVAVAVSGSYAYVTATYSASLVVVDISNPLSPVIRGSVVSSSLDDVGVALRGVHLSRVRVLKLSRALTRSLSRAAHR